MDAYAFADQPPVFAFIGAAMYQSRVPGQRYGNSSSVVQVYNEGVVGDGNGLGVWNMLVKHQHKRRNDRGRNVKLLGMLLLYNNSIIGASKVK